MSTPPPPPTTCSPSCGECNTPVVTDPQACIFTCEPQTGTACDDGDQCTTGDSCQNGVCLGSQDDAEGVACDDGETCTGNDTCQGGSCQGDPEAANGVTCSDGEVCTGNDVCQSGTCVGDPEAANGVSCTDKNVCTGNDVCVSGTCVGDPEVANGVTCSDGEVCTGNDVCTDGACVGNPDVANGNPCNDKQECTDPDVCQAGTCVGDPAPKEGQACADDGNVCTDNICRSGACLGEPVPDNQPCDDEEECTDADKCQAGACLGNPALKEGQACDGDSCLECIGGKCRSEIAQVGVEGGEFVVIGDSTTYFADTTGGTGKDLEWSATNASSDGESGASATFSFTKEGLQTIQAICKVRSGGGSPTSASTTSEFKSAEISTTQVTASSSGQTAKNTYVGKLACSAPEAQFECPSSTTEVVTKAGITVCLRESKLILTEENKTLGSFRAGALDYSLFEKGCVDSQNEFCFPLRWSQFSYETNINFPKLSDPKFEEIKDVNDVTATNCEGVLNDFIPKEVNITVPWIVNGVPMYWWNPKTLKMEVMRIPATVIRPRMKKYYNTDNIRVHEGEHLQQHLDSVAFPVTAEWEAIAKSNCLLSAKNFNSNKIKKLREIRSKFYYAKGIFLKLKKKQTRQETEDGAYATQSNDIKSLIQEITQKAKDNNWGSACENPTLTY